VSNRFTTRLSLHGRSLVLFILPGSLLACLLALPLAAVLWRALEGGMLAQVTQPAALQALRLSLLTSTLSAAVAVLTGTPLAYALARWPFRGRQWLELLVDLPVVLPPSVAGLALLMAFGRRGLVGGWLAAAGLSLPFTTAAVVLAQTFVAAPFYVRAARMGFAAVDQQLEEAAYTEGASQWQLFRHVMLPLAGRGLVGGLVLCWTRALGEFGATILFAGNLPGRTQTMPLAIYLGWEAGNLGLAVALSAVLLLATGLLLALLRRLEAARTE
jgi:molybdate transport system permease protein